MTNKTTLKTKIKMVINKTMIGKTMSDKNKMMTEKNKTMSDKNKMMTEKNKMTSEKMQIAKTKISLIVALCSVMLIMGLAGCGKKEVEIPALKYQVNDDDTVSVIGLTDKGKTDSKIIIPATMEGKQVVSIESEVFRDNQNIKQVIIEEGIKKIGSNAFFNCSRLEQIQIPSTVDEVGNNIVSGSLWAQNILDNQSEVIVNQILVKVKDDIDSYQIPDGVQTVAPGVFYGNQTISEVNCPDSLKNIQAFAFSGCPNLEKVVLPNDIEKIGYSAFSDCSDLTIEMSNKEPVIESEAFDGIKGISYR